MNLPSLRRLRDPAYVWSRLRDPAYLVKRVRRALAGDLDAFLGKVHGVIHVGANQGQERALYASRNLDVIWIEPIPQVFERLQENLKPFPRQRAICALLTDEDGQTYDFHIANNEGASSSIFEFGEHPDIWPTVRYEGAVKMTSTTLSSLVDKCGIDMRHYDAMVLDTQGSELLVMKGAGPLLDRLRFIKTEVADFQAYRGGVLLRDLESFLFSRGFKEYRRQEAASHPRGGHYYDIVYRRG